MPIFEMFIGPTKPLFWGALVFISFTYIGYPLLLFIWSRFSPKPICKDIGVELPSVSIVVCVKNEENYIEHRLENLLQCEYPPDKLQVIVVSDGSNDQTCELVESFIKSLKDMKAAEIILIPLNKSFGKPNGLNLGVEQARGNIIVFTDARQQFKSDAIKRLVGNFGDKTVGCVSGELFFVEDDNSTIAQEMGIYWKIEKLVRRLESKVGSVVGATGAIYAIRKSLFEKMKPALLLDDVFIPMQIVLKGFRCVFDPRAQAYDIPSRNPKQEWQRKKRTLAGCWQLLSIQPSLLIPWENPIWFRFLSHKIFRLLVPFVLLLLFIVSFFIHGWLYQMVFIAQLFFYGTAIVGWLVPRLRSIRIINFIFFFTLLNMAAFSGFLHWISGRCGLVWE